MSEAGRSAQLTSLCNRGCCRLRRSTCTAGLTVCSGAWRRLCMLWNMIGEIQGRTFHLLKGWANVCTWHGGECRAGKRCRRELTRDDNALRISGARAKQGKGAIKHKRTAQNALLFGTLMTHQLVRLLRTSCTEFARSSKSRKMDGSWS